MVLAGFLVGCSAGEEKAVPELPDRICWGMFDSGDVSPILPTGERAKVLFRPFALSGRYNSVTCSVSIDGATKFMAYVNLQEFEGVDWSNLDKANPKPIDVGDKGIFWGRGASAYFACESPTKGESDGRYLDLTVSSDGVSGKGKLETVLPKLLRQFVEFVRNEMKCEEGGAG
ncbi:hypothetical protein [Streptomyces sp. NPDC092952]|uniref:hypothetical protein n=1 Tax=Streptomyces sp. NPDC092952 TaxID=3366018 RepID=UPI00382FB8EA